MRKIIVFLICFVSIYILNAQHNVHFYKSDATVDVFSVANITDIIADSSQKIVSINRKDGNPIQLFESEIDSITFSNHVDTYIKTNEILDVLDGCRGIDWALDGAGYHTGKFDMTSQGNIKIEKITGNLSSKFGDGYKFKRDNPFLQYNETDGYKRVFQFFSANDFEGGKVNKYVVGFWIDSRELKGLPLQFSSHGGGIWEINQSNLKKKGYIAYQENVGSKGFDQVEVTEVDGDFTHITIRSDNSKQDNPQLFNLTIENNTIGITELTLWNPTLLYDEQNIDPYHFYESESQRNASSLRGKTIAVIGDSQQNDGVIVHGLARRLGVNIIHGGMGGHRMRYQNTSLAPFNGWMYKWESRKILLSKEADYYFLMVSSNDSSGGGESSAEATKSVLDNYPVYGDDEATINAKLTLFNTLSENKKASIFDYKQTYSAYITQINALYPNAKIVLSTIPVSSYNVTEYNANGETVYKEGITAESQRIENNWIFESIRNDIYELSNKHGIAVCDLFNEGGITWENLPSKLKGDDSVHWTAEAKFLFVDPIIKCLNSIP